MNKEEPKEELARQIEKMLAELARNKTPFNKAVDSALDIQDKPSNGRANGND